MKLYVGNLSYGSSENDIRELFSQHGQVTDVHVPSDRETGRPRGFAFVTMGSKAEMETAMKALDGQDLDGRALRVNEARARD